MNFNFFKKLKKKNEMRPFKDGREAEMYFREFLTPLWIKEKGSVNSYSTPVSITDVGVTLMCGESMKIVSYQELFDNYVWGWESQENENLGFRIKRHWFKSDEE